MQARITGLENAIADRRELYNDSTSTQFSSVGGYRETQWTPLEGDMIYVSGAGRI